MTTSEQIDKIDSKKWETKVAWIQRNPAVYKLIMCIETGKLFRRIPELQIPNGFIEIKTLYNKSVYDFKKSLLPQYWALERYWINKKEHLNWLGGISIKK